MRFDKNQYVIKAYGLDEDDIEWYKFIEEK